ncbi:MAG TPA: nuclear transport factor 2 family protein [Dictyobacter sp.]|jgi:ketosteroid isomerase-like protein|nr:nuclear transport factor 2 family protein [Dictyobacter sp.]
MSAVTARSIVESQAQKFIAALQERNAAKIAAFHTMNVRVLPPGSPMLQGREAVQGFYQYLLDNGVKDMRFETIDAEFLSENTIQEINHSFTTIQGPDGATQVIKGTAVVLWQLEDGEFKLNVDIWNN